MSPEDILNCWFEAGEERWFAADPVFDSALAIRFRSALAEARGGACDHWMQAPQSALALIILLDQLSRNIHRRTPLAFAADRLALRHAKAAIGLGFHQTMPAAAAMWFVMPFEHSEQLDDQYRAKALFTTLGPPEMIHWAQIHLDIIARFGRFPHRNRILGRASTAEEVAFLAAGGFSG